MLPQTIKIGCYEYKVEETDEVLIVNNTACKGLINYDNHLIRIKKSGMSEQQKEQTFWHEIIHGIIDYRQVDPQKCDPEALVEELALGLYGVMKQNGSLPGQKVGDAQCILTNTDNNICDPTPLAG